MTIIHPHYDYVAALRVRPSSANRGKPPTRIINPFYQYLDVQDRYDRWSEDILAGAARWDHGGTKPLPVRTLYELLEALSELSTATIGAHLGISDRMARRYLAALEVAMQSLMRSRPRWLRAAMGDADATGRELMSAGEVCPIQMAQLRHDLGPDAFAF
ncbi:hypothetical protein PSCICE_33000 [Pseudomonas cichorii]|nr:hypothetical protein [Pseudomonas cichorii]GFM52033.1 hypothetical protein PSCICE_33000 [Pseudomonas cichorii]